MNLNDWANRHGLSNGALAELRDMFGLGGGHELPAGMLPDATESGVQSAVRLEGARKGVRLYRNNVGALIDTRGVPVRYGLANDTPQLNKVIKSADLIGWRTIIIEHRHVGQPIAQFVSRECKRAGWRYTGTEREQAQLAWAQLVVSEGGDAAFCTGEGTL